MKKSWRAFCGIGIYGFDRHVKRELKLKTIKLKIL
jgi:hypothetical protein